MFPSGLRRDVVVLLCIKAAALCVLYFLFFAAKPAVTPTAMEQRLAAPR